LVCALTVSSALAADVALRGRRMVVRANPAGEAHRRVVVVGRAPTSSESFAAPVAGAYLRVFVDGGHGAQSQLYYLEPGGWSAVAGGWRYSGHGASNPIEELLVSVEAGAPSRIRAVLSGNVGTEPLELVPPDPGTSGGVSIGTRDGTFCVVLGDDAGGTTYTDSSSVWRIRNATGEVACPPVPTPAPTPYHSPTPYQTPTPTPTMSPTPTPGSNRILRPSGRGAHGEWGESFPEVGADHWQNVAEVVADEEATFLQDNTWNGSEIDSFRHEASLLPPDTKIDGVAVCLRARQTDVNGSLEDNGIDIVARGARDTWVLRTISRLSAEWTTYCTAYRVDPATSMPWTVASVDALEIGARNAMSPAGPDGVQLTQVWMVVGYTP